jgi:hypothetical protein
MFNNSPPIPPLNNNILGNVVEYDKAKQAANDKAYNEENLRFARRTTMARIQSHTHSIYYVLLYHANKLVTRTRFNITLRVCCLPSLFFLSFYLVCLL